MINQDLPQVKTVKLLFVAMEEQQQAMFKMAFKMHNTTNYEVIDPASGQKPELVIVDGDNSGGMSNWHKAKGDYPGSIVVYFSKSPPSITAPYLSKPIKFDTLFLSLRNLLQGNGVWVVHGGQQVQREPVQTATAHTAHQQHTAKSNEVLIPRFDPNVGVLGAFRKSIQQHHNSVIMIDGKPVLAVFPAIQRVWVAVDAVQLRELCGRSNAEIAVKTIPEDSNLHERVNATITSCMWQLALWTANGRLVQPINPHTVFRLKTWPNLTRLTALPESMRLSAFLTKTPVSLNTLYKLMPLEMADILNYIAATYLTDYLEITQQVQETASSTHTATQTTSVEARREQPQAQRQVEQPKSGGGLLSRFMKKLLNK